MVKGLNSILKNDSVKHDLNSMTWICRIFYYFFFWSNIFGQYIWLIYTEIEILDSCDRST